MVNVLNVHKTSQQLISEYDELTKEQLEENEVPVSLAGRIMTKRGKESRFRSRSRLTGQIQLYVRKDAIGEEQYEIFSSVDIGDLVGVEGVFSKQKLANFLLK